jgi:predicted membrane channel-forming protein YqfA (hemolysin III family)
MQSLFTLCAVIYLLLYAFEGAIRYALYSIGMDNAILLRDALVLAPLILLLIAQARRMRIHPAYWAFAAVIALHGAIAYLNIRTTLPVVYGTKLLVNVLFGFIAARELVLPGRKVLTLLSIVWLASVVGVGLDKFVTSFPWTGLETHVGGISVDVSRGWDISEGFDKRAAGFTRSSISAAMLIATLALIIVPRMGRYLPRLFVLAVSGAAIFFTTQKGAFAAIVAVMAVFACPDWSRYRLMLWLCLGWVAVDIALPLFTADLRMAENGGVFSLSSFAMRITGTWPEAWRWIGNNDVFPFGVGLGGIGGAQRFYAQNFFNPSDNLFIFLYANFGVLSLFYLAWMVWQAVDQPFDLRQIAIAPLAILAFNLGYGAALSMLEDQVSALYFGAAVGMLWQLRQMGFARPWSDPFRGARMRLMPSLGPLPRPAHAVAEL